MQRCLAASGAAQRASALGHSRVVVSERGWQQHGARRVQRHTAACCCSVQQAPGGGAAATALAAPVLQRIAAAAAAGLILIAGGPSEAMAAPTAAAAPSQAEAVCPVGDVAGLFGGDEAGAPEPFTLYGTNFKMYSIEKLDGEKVVSRSRGFTVDTCVAAVDEAAENPEFQGLSTGDKMRSGENLLCKRSTGPDLRPACASSCREACSAALDAEAAKQQAETGLQLSPSDRKRLQRTCVRQCDYGCVGSGKTHDFVTPSRR